MTELTAKQKKRLGKVVAVVEGGPLAIAEHLFELEDELEARFEEKVTEIKDSVPNLSDVLSTIKGKDGIDGFQGETGPSGPQGEAGEDGKDGKPGKDGRDGREGTDGKDGRDGKDGKDGLDGENGSPDTPDQVVEKVNNAKTKVKKSQVEGLEDIERIAKNNQTAVPATTSFVNGKRAKNFSFNGATVTVLGDTAYITTTGGGHTIQDEGVTLTARTFLNFIGAGVTATDDAANDATKVTISTSSGAGYQQPTGGVIDGSNATFTWAVAPNAISVDGGRIMQKVSSDGTTNWTGTTTTILSIAPTEDVFGLA